MFTEHYSVFLHRAATSKFLSLCSFTSTVYNLIIVYILGQLLGNFPLSGFTCCLFLQVIPGIYSRPVTGKLPPIRVHLLPVLTSYIYSRPVTGKLPPIGVHSLPVLTSLAGGREGIGSTTGYGEDDASPEGRSPSGPPKILRGAGHQDSRRQPTYHCRGTQEQSRR